MIFGRHDDDYADDVDDEYNAAAADDDDVDNDGSFNERHFLGSSPGQHSPLLGHCPTLARMFQCIALYYTVLHATLATLDWVHAMQC